MVGPGPANAPIAHSPDRILWDVVGDHVEEAEFLFELLVNSLDSPVYTLPEFREGPEERLRAHLDALDVGGATVAKGLLLPIVDGSDDEDPEPLRVAAAALAILMLSDAGPAQEMFAGFAGLAPDRQHAILAALALADRPEIEGRLPAVAARVGSAAPMGFAEVFRVRGVDLGDGLDAMARSDDESIRVAGARAAMYTDRKRRGWVEHCCTSSEPLLRNAALPAGLVMGSPHAWQVTARLALPRDEVHRDAMVWAAQFGEPAAAQALVGLLDDGETRPHALWALGFSGWMEAADACARWLVDDVDGPVAGEAFAAITGIDPRSDSYWGDAATDVAAAKEGDAEPPPLEKDLEADLSLAPESELRVPNPEAIAAWWAENRSRFNPNQRYILGRPADEASLLHALRTESMRRRHARAFELLVRSRGTARVQTRMMTAAQYRQMDALGSLPRIDGNRPFSRIG